jgi:HAD superfamily hydrolase (TIGR01549 family)
MNDAISPIKAILIDLDNTLLFGDKEEVVERLYATTQSLGLSFTKAEIKVISESTSCMREMRDAIVANTTISNDEFNAAKFLYEGKFDDIFYLKENTIKVLEFLKNKKIPIVIVSTRTSKSIPRILQKLDIFSYFSNIIGRDDSQERKPSPEPIFTALKKLNLTPSKNIYFLGDKQNEDILAAHNAQINSILLAPLLNVSQSQPDYHIKEIIELLKLDIFE